MTLKLKSPRHIFAQERIESQFDGFGERLEGLVKLLIEEVVSGRISSAKAMRENPVLSEMEKVIFSRTRLKVEFIVDEMLAAILPFYANTSHIFLADYFRGNVNIRDQTRLLKNFNGKKGSVNLEKAIVGGIFSEYVHPLYMNFYQLVKQCEFTSAEIVACLLHELGHGFYACYYADRTDETNQVMADVAAHLLNKETGDVEYIYKELSKITPSLKKEAVDQMVNGSRVVAGANWFKITVEVVRSQLVDDTYNQTAFEQRADNFASRFGYGKELVVALDKLHVFAPDKSNSIRLFVQIVSALSFIALASMVFALIATGSVVTAFIFVVYKLLFLSLYREDMQDYTYDKLKVRYLRIRQDAVSQLKSPSLDKQHAKALLDTIYAIDDSIKLTSDVKTLPQVVANIAFANARRADQSITDQQLMEQLSANDLFVQAAEFRTNV